MKIMIRSATDSDIPNILELSKALFLDPTSAADRFADPEWPTSESGLRAFTGALRDGFLWVADVDGAIVGFIRAEVAAPLDWRPIKQVELLSFYITPEYRSNGLGAQLVAELEVWAKQQGARTVFVSAYADNGRGLAFYRENGFIDESVTLEKELK